MHTESAQNYNFYLLRLFRFNNFRFIIMVRSYFHYFILLSSGEERVDIIYFLMHMTFPCNFFVKSQSLKHGGFLLINLCFLLSVVT